MSDYASSEHKTSAHVCPESSKEHDDHMERMRLTGESIFVIDEGVGPIGVGLHRLRVCRRRRDARFVRGEALAEAVDGHELVRLGARPVLLQRRGMIYY